MLFRHPCVGMAKLLRDDRHGNTLHGQPATMRMAQHMEGYGRFYLGILAGIHEWSALMRLPPLRTMFMGKNKGISQLSLGDCLKKHPAFVCQHHMAGLPALAGLYSYRTGIRIEISNAEISEFPIAASGE